MYYFQNEDYQKAYTCFKTISDFRVTSQLSFHYKAANLKFIEFKGG
jgi:hypothetical protein